MGYKVSIHNKYEGGDSLKLEFDTNSALLHHASKDAEQHVFEARVDMGLDPKEKPIFSNITYKPVKGY